MRLKLGLYLKEELEPRTLHGTGYTSRVSITNHHTFLESNEVIFIESNKVYLQFTIHACISCANKAMMAGVDSKCPEAYITQIWENCNTPLSHETLHC
jgi:hypothetical protein